MSMTKQIETRNTGFISRLLQSIAGIVFCVLEAALIFRLAFKLLGANINNGFVQGLYSVTQSFVGLFQGIFAQISIGSAQANMVFEPATLIAMAVVALLGWVVLKMFGISIGTRVVRTENTQTSEQPK